MKCTSASFSRPSRSRNMTPPRRGRRVGVLLRGTSDGLGAVMRTFWVQACADENGEVTLSPIETHIDLRGGFAKPADVAGILSGEFAGIRDQANEAMSSLLDHVRFRFDDSWAAYYRTAAATSDLQRHVVHASLAAVARDTPLLLAFFLLLSAKDATRSLPISRAIINRKRLANGRVALLDHVEVHASLESVHQSESGSEDIGRLSPRLHHVARSFGKARQPCLLAGSAPARQRLPGHGAFANRMPVLCAPPRP